MAAIIEVVGKRLQAYVSKKDNKPASMMIYAAVVTDTDSGEVNVGDLFLPRDHEEIGLGRYQATFRIGVDRDKRVTAYVQKLEPITQARAAVGVPGTPPRAA